MNDFDEKARQWDENPMHLERTKAVAGELLNRVPVKPTMKALEFGAGTGLLSFFIKDRFAEITLMDTSVEMLNMASAKLSADDRGRIATLNFDLEKNEFKTVQFDVIYTQMVLHHIKEIPGILKKFYNMLLPGGYIAIADLFSEDGSFHDPGVDVHHGFDPELLSARLKSYGFRNIVWDQCFVIRKPSGDQATREYPVFLITAER